jgi:hypothetical protein
MTIFGDHQKYPVDAAQITRKGITELHNSIRGLTQKKINTYNIWGALEKLVADFKISGIAICDKKRTSLARLL